MDLVPITVNQYPYLIRWITNAELCYQWAGPGMDYPLTHEQLHQHFAQKSINPFVYISGEEVLGFVELNSKGNNEFRICRVFVPKQNRGRGIAQAMLSAVMDFGITHLDAQRFSLAVFEHNSAAVACYTKLGFTVDQVKENVVEFSGRQWTQIEMTRLV